MANKDIALKWLEQVDEDIATAEALYSTGHCCTSVSCAIRP